MSDFGIQNLDKILDYDEKLITEHNFFWRGYFRKSVSPSVFEYFRGASCHLNEVSYLYGKLKNSVRPKMHYRYG
jgi:hypothetical protein